MSLTQPRISHITASVTEKCHLDLQRIDLVSEDLLLRAGRIAVSRPPHRNAERLAAIAARLEREV